MPIALSLSTGEEEAKGKGRKIFSSNHTGFFVFFFLPITLPSLYVTPESWRLEIGLVPIVLVGVTLVRTLSLLVSLYLSPPLLSFVSFVFVSVFVIEPEKGRPGSRLFVFMFIFIYVVVFVFGLWQ